MDDHTAQILDDTLRHIQRHGFRPITVGGGVDDTQAGAPFTYSVGFRALNHPDVIVTGLPPDRAATFLGLIYQRLRTGVGRTPDTHYDDLAEGYLTMFKPVRPVWRATLMRLTRTIYVRQNGDPAFEAMQLFYPDRFGRWPWDPHVAPGILPMEPRLDLAPRPPTHVGDTTLRAVLGAGLLVA